MAATSARPILCMFNMQQELDLKQVYEPRLNESPMKNIAFNWNLTLPKALQTAIFCLICNAAFAVCDSELENVMNMTDQKNPNAATGANWYRAGHAQLTKDPGSATADVLIRAIKINEDGIARGPAIARDFGQARARAHVSYHQYDMCINKWKLNFVQSRSNRPTDAAMQPSIQNNSPNQNEQQSQGAQQQSQQAQQQAQQTQARADQARQGKRKTHDPAAEAHECIAKDTTPGLFGGFRNQCNYKVSFYSCNFKPRVVQGGFNWSADFDCEQQKFGLYDMGPGGKTAAHTNNTETVYFFACKSPATPVDVDFVAGQGARGRCSN